MIKLTYFNDDRYSFGTFIKFALKKRGMTAIQLSEKSGVSITACRSYIHGDVMPTFLAIVKICEALGYKLGAINLKDKDNADKQHTDIC